MGGGSSPPKKCGFSGGRGGLRSNFHTFIRYFFLSLSFFIQFLWVARSFSGKIGEIFSPPKMCFHTLGGGVPGGVEKIHTFYFFFLKASLNSCVEAKHPDQGGSLQEAIVRKIFDIHICRISGKGCVPKN